MRVSFTPVTVQHCNQRTDYEMIVHPFNPVECTHCAYMGELIGTGWEVK